ALARRLLPVVLAFALLDFADVAQAFDAGSQLDEGAEIGDAQHLALHHFADLVRRGPLRPDVVHLLDAEREAAVLHVDLQDFGFDILAFAQSLARMLGFVGPADVADVDQALDAFLDFHERAEIRHAADAAGDEGTERIFIAQ